METDGYVFADDDCLLDYYPSYKLSFPSQLINVNGYPCFVKDEEKFPPFTRVLNFPSDQLADKVFTNWPIDNEKRLKDNTIVY